MHSRIAAFLLLACFIPVTMRSQQETGPSPVEFVPHGWTFEPLLAPVTESRIGLVAHFNDNSLRLDAGNSIDLLRFRLTPCDGERLTLGADFFTWTALRGEENFHFPVDAVDYLFGANISYRRECTDHVLSARLRISHISAHLVNGSYDAETAAWRNGRLPRVYSREFIDAIAAVGTGWFRLYGGAQYLFHVDPPGLAAWSVQAGGEIVARRLFDLPLHAYAAYDFQLKSVGAFAAVHTLRTGIKIGYWRGRGFNVFITAFNGSNYHGEYYDLRQSYWGSGLTIDF